jgi:prophage regulatory protein
MVRKLLRRRQVEAVTGLGRSRLYDLIADGTFPRPVKLGARAVAWVETEIDAWLAARIAARDAVLRNSTEPAPGAEKRGRRPKRRLRPEAEEAA